MAKDSGRSQAIKQRAVHSANGRVYNRFRYRQEANGRKKGSKVATKKIGVNDVRHVIRMSYFFVSTQIGINILNKYTYFS